MDDRAGRFEAIRGAKDRGNRARKDDIQTRRLRAGLVGHGPDRVTVPWACIDGRSTSGSGSSSSGVPSSTRWVSCGSAYNEQTSAALLPAYP